MRFPEFIRKMPGLDVDFDPDVVRTSAMRSDRGLVVLFHILKDTELAPHAHKAQWGIVLSGELKLTIGDDTKTYRPGDSYDIPSGVTHSARIKADTRLIDIFEEPDRFRVLDA